MRKIKTLALVGFLVLISASTYAQGRIEKLRAEYDSLGNNSGAYLFHKEKGANLRILDINIWEWDGTREKLPKAWVEMDEDCTNEVRSVGFAGVVTAHMPEIVCLQEYSPEMHEELYPKLQKAGYVITFVPGPEEVNFTPIFYRKSSVRLIETAYFPHDLPYNNGRTKSFTTAVFQMKRGGKKFIVANTHLWWKSESAMAGSDNARTQQVRNIIAEAGKLRLKYDCPVFFMGDLNCNLRSETLKVALDAGYKPAWEIATVHADLRCGHHKCDKNGFSRMQNKTDDGFGCIDHFLVYDSSQSVEVKTFVRDYAWFTVKLTDHYPNYADIRLK
jgi:endonuclease/exonuclease/phosphatase family metal-dependent hydrolase